ncbi:hypothetical protein LCGC14_0983100 [marine sediment metagenome]|uniref:site-specific DNA-methyltransferase (adenine-specific) n=1 Tax=marine sediment metagenome TaxID=412755 RepID=A0A0F9N7Z8_9ZZZZ
MSVAEDIQNAIGNVTDQESFIQRLLIDTLHWELDPDALDIEDTAYEYTADELNSPLLDEKCNGRALQLTFQTEIPWGVFLIEFAHDEPFVQARGLTMLLRQLLNALVPKQRRDSSLPAWDREDLLFICTHDYRHFRFAYFQAPAGKEKTAPLKLFGWNEGDTAVRTLCERNLPHLEWGNRENWAEAFNIEKVTKDFYRDYAVVFRRMEDAIEEHNDISGDDLRMFTQMLFNRLMFLRFIERKGWLKFGDSPDYLANLYAAGGIDGQSLFASRLVPLFFEGLAHEDHNVCPEVIGMVPFLNGGLFEKDTGERELDDRVADIPDQAFESVLGRRGLFYRYNFTISESTPLNIEVAVDPEMLGRVFEELVTGRHETGSYYTPRPVVAFMCREALKGHLQDRTSASEEAIESLVDQHEVAQDLAEGQAQEILYHLDTLKACDPACGSGAYLLGLMQELIAIRRALQSEKLKADPEFLYELKLHIISQNLYGVDIDRFATNIAMLRLWLSLSVESDKPQALPNLDFKIETGDSLLGECEGLIGRSGMYTNEINASTLELARLISDHVRTYDHAEKGTLKKAIEDKKAHLKGLLGVTDRDDGWIIWPAEFSEVFAPRVDRPDSGATVRGFAVVETVAPGGFDIVLANPPYVRQELIKDIKPHLKDRFPEVYAGTADLYVYFYARAVQMLREGGVLSFIAPNKFFRAGYGRKLRTYLVDRTELLDLLDFGDYPIFQSITYPSIIVAQRRAEVRDDWRVPSLNWPHDRALADITDVCHSCAQGLLQNELSTDAWRIIDKRIADLLGTLRAAGESLGKFLNGRFYRGIVTGCNEAFEVDEATREHLIQEDPSCAEFIRPWVRGKNIRRWSVEFDHRYVIYAPWDMDIDTFPSLKSHLLKFKPKLERRPECQAGRFNWWCLSRYGSEYAFEYDNPKIFYKVISTYQELGYTEHPAISNDKAWFIPSPPDGLLGLLNSKVVWFFLDQLVPKLQGGAFELRSPYMRQIPVPALSDDLVDRTNRIIELASANESNKQEQWQLEQEIDEIVVGLYGLTSEEEVIIDEAVDAAGNRFPRRFRESEAYKDYVAEMFGDG